MVKYKSYLEAAKIFGFIIVCFLAGIIGGLFTTTTPGSWYANIIKPSFNPPNWIFAPVWTTLYILMGISLYLAVKHKVGAKPIIIFGIQLVLNTLWTIIFFGLQNTLAALLEIILLWIFILWTIKLFYKKSKAAAYLLLPYIIWVTFATVLTIAIYVLN